MQANMRQSSICLYATHFSGNSLPTYIRSMLLEMTKHCQRLVLISESKNWSSASAHFIEVNNIEILFSPNKGYDFGKWYWALKKIKFNQSKRIILLNDSMLLLSSLDNFFKWCNKTSSPVKGFLPSYERSHHLQSYLLVLDTPAIEPTLRYFKRKRRYRSKRKVIRQYELGLSVYWKKKGYTLEAFHTIQENYNKNPNYFLVDELLTLKTPLIKRHILMNTFGNDMKDTLEKQGFNFSKEHYLQLIKQNYSNKDYKAALEISKS